MFIDWLKKTIEQKFYGDEIEGTYIKMVLGYDKEIQPGQIVTLSDYILRTPKKGINLFQGAVVPRYGMFEKYPVGTKFEVKFGNGGAGFRLHHMPLKFDTYGNLDLTDSLCFVTALNVKSRKNYIVLINYEQETDGIVVSDTQIVYGGKERRYYEKDKAYFEVLSIDNCLVKAENINWLKPSIEAFTLI